MFDETSGVEHRTLVGHAGPVYGVSFSPDKYYIISGSEDGTGMNLRLLNIKISDVKIIFLSPIMVFTYIFVFG